MTLIARDEEDVVGEQIRYHLEQGIDFVLATDHRSVDGTTEILRGYERDGHLRLIREEGEGFRQSEWVTRMARLAATEHGADWVINSDADEFWWPRDGSFREILGAVPPRFGVVRGIWRNFALRPDGEEPFHERMTVRRRPVPDPADPYHVQLKVAHRAHPGVVVPRGNHDALADGLVLMREWFPFEVLHFPIRSRAQLRRKYADPDAYRADVDPRVPRHIASTASRVRADADAVYDALVVDEEDLPRGVAEGALSIDTRLRDVLRGSAASVTRASLADDASLAEEIDVLLSTDALHRLAARTDSFEQRLQTVEHRRLRGRRRRAP